MSDIERQVADLFALPPDEFTKARDSLVIQLKASGDEVSAKRIKALRKPAVSVWAVNRLGRERGGELAKLFELGERLTAAQQSMVRGQRPPDLTELTRSERQLVDELTNEAAAALDQIGHRATASIRERITDTLFALATDLGSREAVTSGTLDRDLQRVGFGLDDTTLPDVATLPSRDDERRARIAEAERLAETAAAEARRLEEDATEAERTSAALRRRADDAAAKAKDAAAKAASFHNEP